MTLPLPFANFAVCAMALATPTIEHVVDAAGLLMDQMRDEGLEDDAFGRNFLAVMLYRDCMIRELERRGVGSQWSCLLATSEGRVLRTLDYKLPVFAPELHAQHRRSLGVGENDVRRAIDDHENARIRALPGPSEPGTDGNPGAAA